MTRLINMYRQLPSPSNRAKLAAYLAKHPMATVMATADELHFLKSNGFIK
jgi:hypothetical protein